MKRKFLTFLLAFTAAFGGVACKGGASAASGDYYDVQLWSVSSGGEVVLESNKAKADEDFVLSFLPEQGYKVASFQVNNVECSHLIENGKYTHPSVSERLSFRVKFEVIKEIYYVEKGSAPVIDGEIDGVWAQATSFKVDNFSSDHGEHADEAALAKVLWNEEGLYFLSYIYDSTLTNSDRLNIWVSEKYVTEHKGYSSDKKEGNYAVSVTALGEYLYYSGLNLSSQMEKGVKTFNGGYIVEVFVPAQGEGLLAENGAIGLDFSIDYYEKDREDYANKGTEERVSYAYWAGEGYYWSDVGGLRRMTLVK